MMAKAPQTADAKLARFLAGDPHHHAKDARAVADAF